MEARDDWERILLDGLPEDERRQTLASMAQATVDKRRHIETQNAVEMQRLADDRARGQSDDDLKSPA